MAGNTISLILLVILVASGCTGKQADHSPSHERPSDFGIIQAVKACSHLFARKMDEYSFRVTSSHLQDVLLGHGEEIIAVVECDTRLSVMMADDGLAIVIFQYDSTRWTAKKVFRVLPRNVRSEDNGSIHFVDVNGDGLLDIVGCGHIWHQQEQAGFCAFVAIPALDDPLVFTTQPQEGWLCPMQKVIFRCSKEGRFRMALLTLTLESGAWDLDTPGYEGGRVYMPKARIEGYEWFGRTLSPSCNHRDRMTFSTEIEAVKRSPPFEEMEDLGKMALKIPWQRGCWLLGP